MAKRLRTEQAEEAKEQRHEEPALRQRNSGGLGLVMGDD